MENAEASANPSSSSPSTKAGAQREGENNQDLTKGRAPMQQGRIEKQQRSATRYFPHLTDPISVCSLTYCWQLAWFLGVELRKRKRVR